MNSADSALRVPPRGLPKPEAAAHCGLTPRLFTRAVKQKLLPEPLPFGEVWDVKALDRAMDKLSGLDSEPGSWGIED